MQRKKGQKKGGMLRAANEIEKSGQVEIGENCRIKAGMRAKKIRHRRRWAFQLESLRVWSKVEVRNIESQHAPVKRSATRDAEGPRERQEKYCEPGRARS